MHKTIAFVVLLFVLSCIEDVAISLVHGHAFREALATLGTKTWHQVAATSLLVCLALVPIFGTHEIARAMGTENFRRMVLAKRS